MDRFSDAWVLMVIVDLGNVMFTHDLRRNPARLGLRYTLRSLDQAYTQRILSATSGYVYGDPGVWPYGSGSLANTGCAIAGSLKAGSTRQIDQKAWD